MNYKILQYETLNVLIIVVLYGILLNMMQLIGHIILN